MLEASSATCSSEADVERITVGGNDILSLWPFLKQKMKMNATV
jgi:hypothetical protein